jgi:hypothetical protein
MPLDMSMVSENSAITLAGGWIERFLPSHPRARRHAAAGGAGAASRLPATITASARTRSVLPAGEARAVTPRARAADDVNTVNVGQR